MLIVARRKTAREFAEEEIRTEWERQLESISAPLTA